MDLFGPTRGKSGEIEAVLVVDNEGEWTIPWAAGLPADVGWFQREIEDTTVRDVLEVDSQTKNLAPGRYRVRLTLEWNMDPSTPDSPDEYNGWTNIISVTKEEPVATSSAC